MQHADRHPAAAQDGPLADDVDLTVENQDGRERWPTPVVWSMSGGERHVYELMAVEVDGNLALHPVYTFRRTLSFGEPEPDTAWIISPRYLM
jgi:hypothetical protein